MFHLNVPDDDDDGLHDVFTLAMTRMLCFTRHHKDTLHDR